MVKFFDSCPPYLLEWVEKQHLFWVATAPLTPDGHVNVSPKGAYDCFHIINANKIWYEDFTGSGNETISHLRENRRITVMFIAFDGPPRIVRFFGTGTVYEYGTPEYERLLPSHIRKPGSRAAIVVDVHKVGSSCGYSVPFYEFRGNRTKLLDWAAKLELSDSDFAATNPTADPHDIRAENGLRSYWLDKNAKSIDGLPGVLSAPYSKDVPTNMWDREREIAQSKAAVDALIMHRVGDEAHIGVHLESFTKLAVGFALGVLTTTVLVRANRLLNY